MFSFRHTANQPTSDTKYGSHYERRGERVTRKIASAAGQKSWKWIAVNLAWTAGPVTFIALQIGYYLGYGKFAPLEIFFYFAGYTVMAGLLAVASSIVYDAFYQPKVQDEQKQLLETMNQGFALWYNLRDRMLTALDPQERVIMAAYYTLQGANANPSSVGTAVMDLTQSINLTRAARNIQVFADQGMSSRVAMIQEHIQSELRVVKEVLEPIAPQAYGLLEARLRGETLMMKRGVERCDGFIERVLSAAEAGDVEALSLHDAYEMVTLALELLSGRKIAVLDTRLKGDDQLEEAQEDLDEARHHYRMALRRRNSRILQLVETLYEETDINIVVNATDKTSRLIEAMEQGLAQMSHQKRRHYRSEHEAIMQLNKQLTTRYNKLIRQEKAYVKIWKKLGEKLTLAMQSSDIKHAGFYIQERSVSLNDKEKMRLMHVMSRSIGEADPEEMSASTLAKVVFEIAGELDDLIDMSQPEEQIAIESSNAANFNDITKHVSASTKAGWAALAVDAMHENRRKAAHRLARNMMVYFKVPLTEPIIELLCEQFGADEDYLREMSEQGVEAAGQGLASLPTKPHLFTPWEKIGKIIS